MNRLDMLKFIQEIKELSFKELKDLKKVITNQDKIKLIDLELARKMYASN